MSSSVSIDREIASVRSKPGWNWLASALGKLQDHSNSLASQLAVLSAAKTASAPPAAPPDPPAKTVPVYAPVNQYTSQATQAGAYILPVAESGMPKVNFSDSHVNKSLTLPATDQYTTSTPIKLVYATWTQIASITIPVNGGAVILFIAGQYDNQDTASTQVGLQFYRNGTVISTNLESPTVPFKTAGEFMGFDYSWPDMTPGSGSNTYSVSCYLYNNVNLYVNMPNLLPLTING